MPDSIRSCGELMTPPETITSRSARTVVVALPPVEYSTPTARLPSITTRCASALVTTVRLGRLMAGRRKATAALQRRPLRMVDCSVPSPSFWTPL